MLDPVMMPHLPPEPVDPVGAIKLQLRLRDLHQNDLAAALGLSEHAISRRLSGEVEFRVSELYAAALFLGVPAASLLPEPREDSAANLA